MTMERHIRAIADSFVLLSLLLGYISNPYWHLFTAFVAPTCSNPPLRSGA